MSMRETWEKLSIAIAVPMSFGFVLLAVTGQMCLDNFPYLSC